MSTHTQTRARAHTHTHTATALVVPPELLAFLHVDEPVRAGIMRLNQEWGAKAGDKGLEQKLLKLIAVWLGGCVWMWVCMWGVCGCVCGWV